MVAGDAQRRVQRLIDELVESGAEVGLQVAVVREGEVVVDAVAGHADARGDVLVAPDTLFYAASTAKGVASTVAHTLVDRGELSYDLRAAEVWPEFAVRGKERVSLRHVLLHTAGVPAPPYDVTVDDLCDWERICHLLADTEPWWEPGTKLGYHALTFGFLLGEIVRRATGRTLSACLRELVTVPLSVEDDVHFGVSRELLGRVATEIPPVGPAPEPPRPGSPIDRAIPPGVRPDADYANRSDVLTSDIPSGGTMTARGAATIYAAVLGHLDGVNLVSAERRPEIARRRSPARTRSWGSPRRGGSGTARIDRAACPPDSAPPLAWSA